MFKKSLLSSLIMISKFAPHTIVSMFDYTELTLALWWQVIVS